MNKKEIQILFASCLQCFFFHVVKSTCLLCFVFLSFLYWLNFASAKKLISLHLRKRIRCIQKQKYLEIVQKKSILFCQLLQITKKSYFLANTVKLFDNFSSYRQKQKKKCKAKSLLCHTFKLYILNTQGSTYQNNICF